MLDGAVLYCGSTASYTLTALFLFIIPNARILFRSLGFVICYTRLPANRIINTKQGPGITPRR